MLDIALKEWSVTCDLMLEGRQTILLRKGGIHELAGPGRFELEHDRFLLFPSWLHQQPEMMKEEYRSRVRVFGREPAEVEIKGWGAVAGVWRIPSRSIFDELDDLHGWAAAQVDMRFAYKPANPIYLVAVRAYRLVQPRVIRNAPAYGGCKSWVPLAPADAVDDAGATPVVGEQEFAQLLERIRQVMPG